MHALPKWVGLENWLQQADWAELGSWVEQRETIAHLDPFQIKSLSFSSAKFLSAASVDMKKSNIGLG